MNIITYQQLYKAIDKLTFSLLKKHGFSNIKLDTKGVPYSNHGPINIGVRGEKL